GQTLVKHYRRETVIMTTQLVAHVLFRKLVQATPGVDLFGRVRRRGEITWAFADYVRSYLETRDRLRNLASLGEVHIDSHVETDTAERAFERTTYAWNGFHTKTVARLENGGDGDAQIVLEDPALLLYYLHPLVPFAESLASEDEQTAEREIA